MTMFRKSVYFKRLSKILRISKPKILPSFLKRLNHLRMKTKMPVFPPMNTSSSMITGSAPIGSSTPSICAAALT